MLAAALLCLVVGVSDGDTITARCDTGDAAHPYQQVKVRLAGIDAPEKAQPFGNRSKEALSDLCFQQQAQLKTQGQDRYGRTIADVQCRGQDAGAHLVRGGWAWVYDKYSKGHEDLYPIQYEAQQARRGLWRENAVPPWEWRRAKREAGRE